MALLQWLVVPSWQVQHSTGISLNRLKTMLKHPNRCASFVAHQPWQQCQPTTVTVTICTSCLEFFVPTFSSQIVRIEACIGIMGHLCVGIVGPTCVGIFGYHHKPNLICVRAP